MAASVSLSFFPAFQQDGSHPGRSPSTVGHRYHDPSTFDPFFPGQPLFFAVRTTEEGRRSHLDHHTLFFFVPRLDDRLSLLTVSLLSAIRGRLLSLFRNSPKYRPGSVSYEKDFSAPPSFFSPVRGTTNEALMAFPPFCAAFVRRFAPRRSPFCLAGE